MRNLVDQLHGYPLATALNDIDLVYFDKQHAHEQHDLQREAQLQQKSALSTLLPLVKIKPEMYTCVVAANLIPVPTMPSATGLR